AKGLVKIRDEKGVKALAGFGSAKGSNEEAYLFQKLVRTGFGSNNVDHCTRLCHASSVAALMEGLNSGAVSAPFAAAMDAEVIVVIGANPTVNHPVAATYIKNAAKRGAKLIVMDPRRQSLSRHAWRHLACKPGRHRALPDRAGADDRASRPSRHRPASAARPEQRAGRLRRRPDPDVPAGLPAGRTHRSARALRASVAPEPRSGARPHRGRDHQRDPRRRDHRHVYRGGESRDVGPGSAARARGPCKAGASG